MALWRTTRPRLRVLIRSRTAIRRPSVASRRRCSPQAQDGAPSATRDLLLNDAAVHEGDGPVAGCRERGCLRTAPHDGRRPGGPVEPDELEDAAAADQGHDHPASHEEAKHRPGLGDRQPAERVELPARGRRDPHLGRIATVDPGDDPWSHRDQAAARLGVERPGDPLRERLPRGLRHRIAHEAMPAARPRVAQHVAEQGPVEGRRDGDRSPDPPVRLDRQVALVGEAAEDDLGGKPCPVAMMPYRPVSSPKIGPAVVRPALVRSTIPSIRAPVNRAPASGRRYVSVRWIVYRPPRLIVVAVDVA